MRNVAKNVLKIFEDFKKQILQILSRNPKLRHRSIQSDSRNKQNFDGVEHLATPFFHCLSLALNPAPSTLLPPITSRNFSHSLLDPIYLFSPYTIANSEYYTTRFVNVLDDGTWRGPYPLFPISVTGIPMSCTGGFIPLASHNISRNASGQGHSTVNFPVRNEGGRCARLLIYTVTPI
jgi:hypothetical protein